MAVTFLWPRFGSVRGPGFWVHPKNWLASRKKLRRDYTVDWRRRYEAEYPVPPARSVPFEALTHREAAGGFSFVVLGDTGEGDRSQYGLLPLIRALAPDFLIINGDLAYPAGREQDFIEGFFAPYQNLHIPVWATPGNHEYYSEHNGREFFDLFCTSKHQKLWQDYGLRHVRQPGTYWELASPACPLAVIGLDTGMTAALDATPTSDGDAGQLSWLEWRLRVLHARGGRAIVLFHIPALVNQERDTAPHLDRLHSILIRFAPAVVAVIAAHEHSLQYYSPRTFASFVTGTDVPAPHYFVSGAGGAFLSPINFDAAKGTHRADVVFPDRSDWRQYVRLGSRTVGVRGLARSVLARAIRSLEGAFHDSDLARFLSLIQVRVAQVNGRWDAKLVVYGQPSLEALYAGARDMTVDVRDALPLPPAENVAACERLTLDLQPR
jgi:3',5'-cyclic AMP phosphodiesterase CpdA